MVRPDNRTTMPRHRALRNEGCADIVVDARPSHGLGNGVKLLLPTEGGSLTSSGARAGLAGVGAWAWGRPFPRETTELADPRLSGLFSSSLLPPHPSVSARDPDTMSCLSAPTLVPAVVQARATSRLSLVVASRPPASTRRRRAALRPSLRSRSEPAVTSAAPSSREGEVLDALRQIVDPDFGEDIVTCGFVQRLVVDGGSVSFTVELTTPACPVKAMFERECNEKVKALPWVDKVDVTMSSRPVSVADAGAGSGARPGGLASVKHVIAVSSCKGGVGKSTTAVNLAYQLAQMGARVGIFDADVYGPSLPTMTSPDERVLRMDPETRQLTPTEYMGVKLVSFGFAGQGSAIMRGAMVSGVVQQLLETSQASGREESAGGGKLSGRGHWGQSSPPLPAPTRRHPPPDAALTPPPPPCPAVGRA